jgi:uncharacterized protein
MDHFQTIASQLGVQSVQVRAVVELLDQGNTIPFIARYRKEITRSLDEEQIRAVEHQIHKLRSIEDRRETILKSLEEQGVLSDELYQRLFAAQTQTALEDIYQPYRPRRRTKASIARERGLAQLAGIIIEQSKTSKSLEELAKPFLSEEVISIDDAWAGARDIVAELISDHPDVRRLTREKAYYWGSLVSEKIEESEDEKSVYLLYYSFAKPIENVKAYQVLAINRGEAEKVLRVGVRVRERDWRLVISSYFPINRESILANQLEMASSDAAERLLLPAIERDIRNMITDAADTHAIGVFASNLRALLNQPPLTGYIVMGIDPAYRTGCKLAIVDPGGKVFETATIYPHEPHKRWEEAIRTLDHLIQTYEVSLIAIGNGTASRETEQLVAEIVKGKPLKYIIVNEAGASVYSASSLARIELPALDVSMRGAVSIARRIQDPLAELVKIDPKAIGVGLYQHDVNQKRLAETLNGVVESVVNQVGVEVSTASVSLLTHVAGIGPKLAERIVSHRHEKGAFQSRSDLQKVPGFGPKTYEQAIGFIRVRDSEQPLDNTAIHPESYQAATNLLSFAGISLHDPFSKYKEKIAKLQMEYSLEWLAEKLSIGIPTLVDILEQLIRPGRDPRLDAPLPVLRSDVLHIEDLKPGMILKGTVRNVVDFGAFIDIGVKQDGLLHKTQIPRGEQLEVGQVIGVEIISTDVDRNRIGLGWVSVSQGR